MRALALGLTLALMPVPVLATLTCQVQRSCDHEGKCESDLSDRVFTLRANAQEAHMQLPANAARDEVAMDITMKMVHDAPGTGVRSYSDFDPRFSGSFNLTLKPDGQFLWSMQWVVFNEFQGIMAEGRCGKETG